LRCRCGLKYFSPYINHTARNILGHTPSTALDFEFYLDAYDTKGPAQSAGPFVRQLFAVRSSLIVAIPAAAFPPPVVSSWTNAPDVVGADVLVRVPAQTIHDQIHQSPDAHQEYKTSHAIESEVARLVFGVLVVGSENEKPERVPDEKKQRQPKDERYQDVIDKRHYGDNEFLNTTHLSIIT
jgi:hypothetical protein